MNYPDTLTVEAQVYMLLSSRFNYNKQDETLNIKSDPSNMSGSESLKIFKLIDSHLLQSDYLKVVYSCNPLGNLGLTPFHFTLLKRINMYRALGKEIRIYWSKQHSEAGLFIQEVVMSQYSLLN